MIGKLLFSGLLISAQLVVSEYAQPTNIQSWRLKTPKQNLPTSNDDDVPKWDIATLEFYENSNCEPGSKISPSLLGTVIVPTISNVDDRHKASMAFDDDDFTFYRGKHDSSDAFWIGLQFDASTTQISSHNIRCIRLLQRQENFALEACIEEYDGFNWINRQDVLLRSGWSQILMTELPESGSLVGNESLVSTGIKQSTSKKIHHIAQRKQKQSGRLLTGTNVASTGTATQVSTANGGVAFRAIDGNRDGTWGNDSVTHTPLISNPWWNLQLSYVYTIETIIIYNRKDCCSEQLIGFNLFIYKNETEVWSSVGNYDTTGVERDSYTLTIPAVDGDQVKISLPRLGILSLAEVEIYAFISTDIPSLSMTPSREPSREPSVLPSVSIRPSTEPSREPSFFPSVRLLCIICDFVKILFLTLFDRIRFL
jgi:hypothetical protein